MLKLNASYSKKVPAEGEYSSQSYHASVEWSRCIAIRNSHDRTIAVGLAAGLTVQCCSNLMLGGSMVLKRRHTSRIELNGLVMEAIDELETSF